MSKNEELKEILKKMTGRDWTDEMIGKVRNVLTGKKPKYN